MLFRTVLVLCYFFIGTESFRGPLESRIIGGTEATDRSLFAHQAAVYYKLTILQCGASIIHENYVLTAASCLVFADDTALSPSNLNIVTGNLASNDFTIMKDVAMYSWHSLFNASALTNGYDVAVIKIIGSFGPWTEDVQPISLKRDRPTTGSCIMSGWGKTTVESTLMSPTLMYVEMDVTDWSLCNMAYLNAVGKSIPGAAICAGRKGKSECEADGGGPLVCSGQLAGISSFGIECGEANVPGVYTEVAAYVGWIENVILPKTTTTSTTEEPLTTKEPTTTSTTEEPITTKEPTTTSTTEEPITTKEPTTTSTTEEPLTTKEPTTTSTTEEPITTKEPTTTSTTEEPITTKEPTTTSTTEEPITTKEPTTTSTTEEPLTTKEPTTTSTTEEPITTKEPTTTSTTEEPITTKEPTTTSTTEEPITTKKPTTTKKPSTTKEPSTTAAASTTPCITKTTTLSTTTVASTTEGASTTTDPGTSESTTAIPFCKDAGSVVVSKDSVILFIVAAVTILTFY